VAQGDAGQVCALCSCLGPQFGGTERAQVEVDEGQPPAARGEHGRPFLLRLVQRRAGQASNHPGVQVSPPVPHGGPEVVFCLDVAAAGKGQSAGEQVSVRRARTVEVIHAHGQSTGPAQEQDGTVTRRV
jgi:hypothetical protein